MKNETSRNYLLVASLFPGTLAYPSPCSHAAFACSCFWNSRTLVQAVTTNVFRLGSGLNGWMGWALISTGVHFFQDHYSRFPVWFLLTQNGRGETGALFINRQDGQEVAAAFSGEQDCVSSVPASSTEQGTFPESCLWTRFLLAAFDHSAWVLGPFPVPFYFTKSSQKIKPWFPQI